MLNCEAFTSKPIQGRWISVFQCRTLEVKHETNLINMINGNLLSVEQLVTTTLSDGYETVGRNLRMKSLRRMKSREREQARGIKNIELDDSKMSYSFMKNVAHNTDLVVDMQHFIIETRPSVGCQLWKVHEKGNLN